MNCAISDIQEIKPFQNGKSKPTPYCLAVINRAIATLTDMEHLRAACATRTHTNHRTHMHRMPHTDTRLCFCHKKQGRGSQNQSKHCIGTTKRHVRTRRSHKPQFVIFRTNCL